MSRKLSLTLLVTVLALLVAVPANAFLGDQAGTSDGQRFIVSIDNISDFAFHDSGVFSIPVGAAGPGPLLPGGAYEWTFHAMPGDRLSFATMLVQTNDWFLAPAEPGIPLYSNGSKMTGDVTQYVAIWDAGTEGDEPLGEGGNQAPRQSGPDTGPVDPTGYVRHVLTDLIPQPDELVRVTLQDAGYRTFVLRIENISGSSDFPTPLAPGVGVVHTAPAPLFINGEPDFGMGLEGLAEDGAAGPLADALAAHVGVNTPLAPVAYTVHTELNPLFTLGERASTGLERLAEDGGPADLVAMLPGDAGAAAVGHGASGPGPIFPPDGNYAFEIVASPGDHLSLASMLVQSNDWFYALQNQPLFDANGEPIRGDFTHVVRLYDAGTEVDQPIGFGSTQAPRQAGPNTGPAQGGTVQAVMEMPYGSASTVLHLTITPLP
ncbi:MAG: spondin domain-containing protein [Anaerolineae bacterium]